MQPEVLVASLLAAFERRDDLAEARLLDPDCGIVVDTGDGAGSELRGRAQVARELEALRTRHPDAASRGCLDIEPTDLSMSRHLTART